MSLLSRYLDWFTEQRSAVQVGSVVVIFTLLFASGVLTAGILPGVVVLIVLFDHWYRNRA